MPKPLLVDAGAYYHALESIVSALIAKNSTDLDILSNAVGRKIVYEIIDEVASVLAEVEKRHVAG